MDAIMPDMANEENLEGVEGGGGPAPVGRWGQDRRLEFIEYRLRWAGRLNRSDITRFFGISVPQASLDLAEYSRRAPQNLDYDKRTRSYVLGNRFEPVFPATNHERYLSDLLRESDPSQVESPLGWHPAVACVPAPGRHVNGDVVATIVRAIREDQSLRVLYQSMNRPEPSARRLTPHALAHDGQRWHLRAYCHVHNDFRDFVITRILAAELGEADRSRGTEDRQWHHMLRLTLAPHPELTEAQRRAVELEYGMVSGTCQFECREALLFYVLRRLRLDGVPGTAKEQQIILQNRVELEPFLPKSDFR